MKGRSIDRQKLVSKLDQLQDRVSAAEAETKRVAAKRIATERKLTDLGRQLAGLKRNLTEIMMDNGR
jgi:septal ring factor EnvC (AmiA/AmiB activator)